MDIPADLAKQVREGQVVIFLGAGASASSKTPDGRPCPTSKELGKMLSDEFLGGHLSDGQLAEIAELAISERDLGSVQSFIRSRFLDLKPTEAHKLLPRFARYGLVTTNYDMLVEDTYANATAPLQQVRPMIENRDRIEDLLRDRRNVLLLKLHGCITRITNEDCPLILTPDQYQEHRKSRSRLFNTLLDWGSEHPLVFIGHSIRDSDIRSLLLELKELGQYRPRYFIVAPDADEIRGRYWETKKITLVRGDFEDFLRTLDSTIPPAFRSLVTYADPTKTHPIQKHFASDSQLTAVTREFLDTDVDYVNAISATEHVNPKEFYKGYTAGFSVAEQDLDVRRRIGNDLTLEYFIRDQHEKTTGPEVVLIKAHAGAGKSVILHRLAWDASRDYDSICLFAKPQGNLSAPPLQELVRSLRRRVYLFVDDATDRSRELETLLTRIGPEGDFLTIVMAERINEWNVQGMSLARFLTDEYELKYLDSAEIDSLLALLERHHALGTLQRLNPEDRKKELSEHAGRQLLVALHEATLGRPFEEILVEEFNHITPFEAQRLYQTVCVLNRLNVPVRAGLIARVHGIPFDEFKKRFLAPLEHVVFAQYDPIIRDYQYRARHPHIADIVFLKVFRTTEDRYDSYIKCLKGLNVAFTVDWKAFWQMVRAKNLLDLFPNLDMVRAIFAAARETVGEDAHLLHQMGLYEMNRPNGDITEASRLLARASTLAPYDAAIKHSIAEHKLKAADKAKTPLEKSKLLRDAAEISAGLISGEKTDSYAHHTIVKVKIRELEDGLNNAVPESEIEALVKSAEAALFEAKQEFPGDSYLLEAESRLARILKDDARAVKALQKAFETNARNSVIATRLARQLEQAAKTDSALGVLKKALEANNGDRRLHYAYARLLMNISPQDGEDIAYHLQRAFTDGDYNYEAQLLYGRQLFINNRLDESRIVFRRLSAARVAPQTKNRLLYPIEGKRFVGRMSRPQGPYSFITRDGPGDLIYVHAANVPEDIWQGLTMGTRVQFSIAFTFRGTSAFDLTVT